MLREGFAGDPAWSSKVRGKLPGPQPRKKGPKLLQSPAWWMRGPAAA